jgi:conjugal transfer pilin signal peptidase TrbI
MRGYITPIVVWGLAATPLVLAVCRVPRRVFLVGAVAVGAGGIAAWVAVAGFGYGISENMTSSLDGHIYVYRKGEPFNKGDLVAYRWHGGATYPTGTVFIKRVVGMPGDLVKRSGSEFWVGDQYIGVAKPVSRAGVPLSPATGGVIAAGEYFVATPNPDSLDSRYGLAGNVKQFEMIGKAYEIF